MLKQNREYIMNLLETTSTYIYVSEFKKQIKNYSKNK